MLEKFIDFLIKWFKIKVQQPPRYLSGVGKKSSNDDGGEIGSTGM